MNKEITISIEEHKQLVRDSKTLSALDNGGVSNWEWYGDSLAPLLAEEEIEDAIEEQNKIKQKEMDDFLCEMGEIVAENADVDKPTGPEGDYSISIDSDFLKKTVEEFITKRIDKNKTDNEKIEELRKKLEKGI